MPPRVKRTANLSARARALRYRLLEDHARAIEATRIATAHHADDQLETLIMRLNRGSGVAGLAGLRPTGGMTIRPLLGWRRAARAALTTRCGLTAIEDPSHLADRSAPARTAASASRGGRAYPYGLTTVVARSLKKRHTTHTTSKAQYS